MSEQPYFTFDNVSYLYEDGTAALQNLSFDIPQNKKIAILGENGSGKSTLFKLIAGLIKPTSGTISFLGHPFSFTKKELRRLREQVGIIFQDADYQLFAPTVKQDVLYGPVNLGWHIEKVHKMVDEAMQLTELSPLANKPIQCLSGGQKKRVSIAGVYVMEPSVFILDEPTSNLDYYFSKQLKQYLTKLDGNNRTFLYATHHTHLIYDWADYYLVLHKGQLLYAGEREALFANDSLLQQAHIEKPMLLEFASKLKKSHPKWADLTPSGDIDHLIRQMNNNF
ncbi:cobalt/nickel transport system ATP-binding protein [Bacillus ectoiniformans]|uniref:energy-coupling factor ABC transporter ATP-binding protein n=1 Tax=Bacillus ectoiniformans TaxID=1494429 RepID=UPI0019574A4E|nr:ABC transporter ATP-binding protein [Bacillus ectoiniformans]MBM7647835.1 cobalt/nickel transport system ATP-binding protein [Bacillus ectoiniformans]